MAQTNTFQSPTTWHRISQNNLAELQRFSTETGIDLHATISDAQHHPKFTTLPVNFYTQQPRLTRHQLTIVLLSDQIVTLHSDDSAALFDAPHTALTHSPDAPRTPAHITLDVLSTLNEMNERTVEYIMRQLDDMNSEIHDAIAGHNTHGAPLGVSDMRVLMTHMNDFQEVLAHTQESQFQLLRAQSALRRHSTDHPTPSDQLGEYLDRIEADATAVKKYAGIALDRMSAMQHSITAMLEVKQHEIVKVFTIITAVFLPPTLIATFYGMNFENMPALATQHGFLITTVLTFIAAVIPLWYIKQKGWLR